MTRSLVRIGVTGGIGCGKSVFCQLINHPEIAKYDIDKATKNILQHNQTIIDEIRSIFGVDCVTSDGRKQIREIICELPDKKKRLEELMHPVLIGEFEAFCEKVRLSSNYQLLLPHLCVGLPPF